MEKFKISIGDWSQDGHNQYVELVYNSNYPVIDMQNAYKASCKKLGIQFNHNENYMGIKDGDHYGTKRHVCTEYQECEVSRFAVDVLKGAGIAIKKDMEAEDFAELILDFIKLSMPEDFEFKEAAFKNSELKDITPLNGWWNKELNVQFGYGIMGD